jgi:hypothetical protein
VPDEPSGTERATSTFSITGDPLLVVETVEFDLESDDALDELVSRFAMGRTRYYVVSEKRK